MRFLWAITLVIATCAVGYGETRNSAAIPAVQFAVMPPLSDYRTFRHENREAVAGIIFEDHSAAFSRVDIVMKPEWDGKTLRLSALVLILGEAPSGNIRLDWVGQCIYEEIDHKRYAPWHNVPHDKGWPVETSDGVMEDNMVGYSQFDLVRIRTAGDIPLNGCDKDDPDKHKILWLQASIDGARTTVLRSKDFLFLSFTGDYGIHSGEKNR